MERRLILVAGLAMLLGCNSASDSNRPKTYQATGKVTLNGKPVEGATVDFIAMDGKGSSTGVTDANGEYFLSTFTSNDGALPGQYKVSIKKYDTPPAPKSTAPPGQLASGEIDAIKYVPPAESGAFGGDPASDGGSKNLIPAQYSSPDTSGLRAMVSESNDNVNNFDLKS